jgi:hypothetical protein
MAAKTGTSVGLLSLLRNWPRFGRFTHGMTTLLGSVAVWALMSLGPSSSTTDPLSA